MLLVSELRRRWRSYVGLAAVVGLCGAVTFASLGGARRRASAFDRYLAATDASQLSIFAPPYRPETVEAMRSLPGVVSVQSYAALPMQIVDGRTGEPTPVQPVEIVASVDGLFLDQDRVALLHGRLPDPQAADQVLVSRSMAEQAHLKPGDQMHFGAADPRTFAPLRQLTATVTGVGVMSQEVASDDVDLPTRVIFTPGFLRENSDLVADADDGEAFTYVWSGLRLRPGVEPAAVKSAWEERGAATARTGSGVEDNQTFYRETDVLRAKVQRSVRPQVVALAVFGAVAALVSLVVIGQATRRVVSPAAEENRVLAALGATRAAAGASSLAAALGAAVVGGVLALVGSAFLSALTPVGVVRAIEPGRGPSLDALVVGPGLLVLGAAVAAVAAWAGMRAKGGSRVLRPHEWLGRMRLPVPCRVGVEFLADRRSGAGRSAVAGAVVATVALVATLTMSQSLQHLFDSPRLYGNDFDAMVQVGGGYGSVDPDLAGQALDALPEVTGWSTVGFSQLPVDGRVVPVMALRQGRGTASPTLASGRPPRRGEVVLGGDTLGSLGRRVGDTVDMSGAPRQIVGSAVFPAAGQAVSDHSVLGVGIWMDGQDLEEVTSQDAKTSTNAIFVRLRAETDVHAFLASIQAKYQAAGGTIADDARLAVFAPPRPAELIGLKGMAKVPLAFSGILVAGALVALALALVAAVRRGRRDLAVLKTLGFTKGQTYATVASQATATVVLGGLIGVPLGLAAGRVLWSAFAADLGVVSQSRWPVLLVAAAGLGGLMAANLVALLPGRVAAASHPADVLRRD